MSVLALECVRKGRLPEDTNTHTVTRMYLSHPLKPSSDANHLNFLTTMLKKYFFLSTLLSLGTCTYTEIVAGHKFITSGPKFIASKETYELETHKTAVKLLKDRLGEEGLLNILQPDIKAANAFWHDVISKSSGSWVSADAQAVGFFPNLTAVRFALWSQSPLADASNNEANAEHYMKRTVEISPGILASEILEGWGGVTTLFGIPNYGTPNRTTYPFLRPLPEYPYQAAGDKVLRDGTDAVFGVLHISIRDVDGAEFGEEGKKGVQVYSSVWYGDACTDDFLEAERRHMVIEIINLTIQAQKDLESGDFTPPV